MPVIQRLAAASARGFGLGVGGVGYSAVISESASISDSVNWGTPYQGNISESATGSDIIVASGEPSIGSFVYGGYYAGMIDYSGTGAGPFYYLIVSPYSTYANKDYKTSQTSTGGANSSTDGAANTAYLVGVSPVTYPAAGHCDGLTTNGYTDWYLPAVYELEICYYNLKPTTQANVTDSDTINPYAVPPRNSPYTTSIPARTTVAAFQSGGSEAFIAERHWTSTNYSTSSARIKSFYAGDNNVYPKDASVRVRAIRKVLVT